MARGVNGAGADDMEADLGAPSPAEPPSSANGEASGSCKCGRPIKLDTGRCTRGHVQKGNGIAVITGSRSVEFWRAHAEAASALVAAVVTDAGTTVEQAPRALLEIANGLAQSVLVRDSAFITMAADGGPLTTTGRGRKCLAAWLQAQAAVERHCRLLGLRREPKPTLSPLDNVRAAVLAATPPPSDMAGGVPHPDIAPRRPSQTISLLQADS